MVLLLEILRGIRCVGFGGFASLWILFHNPGQLLRIAEWQRSKQNCVDHAEYGYVRPDAECENQHRDSCEAAIPPQYADSVTQVLRQDVDPGQSSGLAVQLTRLLHPAESDKCLTPGFFRRQTTSDVFFHGHLEM